MSAEYLDSVINGEALETLKTLPDNTVQTRYDLHLTTACVIMAQALGKVEMVSVRRLVAHTHKSTLNSNKIGTSWEVGAGHQCSRECYRGVAQPGKTTR